MNARRIGREAAEQLKLAAFPNLAGVSKPGSLGKPPVPGPGAVGAKHGVGTVAANLPDFKDTIDPVAHYDVYGKTKDMAGRAMSGVKLPAAVKHVNIPGASQARNAMGAAGRFAGKWLMPAAAGYEGTKTLFTNPETGWKKPMLPTAANTNQHLTDWTDRQQQQYWGAARDKAMPLPVRALAGAGGLAQGAFAPLTSIGNAARELGRITAADTTDNYSQTLDAIRARKVQQLKARGWM